MCGETGGKKNRKKQINSDIDLFMNNLPNN